MLFNNLAIILASALAATAHPALQELNKWDSNSYTCGDAYNDCPR